MSFTTDVCTELLTVQNKKTCCRKAFLLGLVLSARSEKDALVSYFYHEETATLAKELLDRIFHAEPTLANIVRAGRKTTALSFRSATVADFLRKVDAKEKRAEELVGFRCPACEGAFLRGAFLATGTVSDPHKEYHLEFSFLTEGRAELLLPCLSSFVGVPGRVHRGTRFGLYYKGNATISDLLYLLGSSTKGFEVANACIERDIRNHEHRVTNCEASNISRSVGASHKQILAIEQLQKTRKIDTLSDELRQTAALRLENPSASLSELALLHTPPITKSGLNRRLTKLMEAAEEDALS